MKLSITKLNELLHKKELVAIYYFTIDNYCSFVMVKCKKTAETAMIYIQSTYEIRLRPDNERVFELKYYDMDDIKQTFENEEEIKFESITLTNPKINLENRQMLLRNYKTVINMESKEQHFHKVKILTNQMKRVRLCLEKNKYKSVLIHNRFLICLHRDNRIESYMTPSFIFSKDIQFKLLIDLESFLEKISTFSKDIQHLRLTIYKIFNSNIKAHLKKFMSVLQQAPTIIDLCNKSIQKKNEYKKQLKNFNTLTEPLNEQIELYYKQIEINKRNKDLNKNLGIEHKLGKLLKKREDLMTHIKELHQISDHYIFNMDNILFDNLIHINTILKNLENI